MTNKLVLSRYGNDQYRFFGVNTPLLNNGSYFDKYSDPLVAESSEPRALSIFEDISKINLVEEVTVRKYEVSVGIALAFANDDEEWQRIIDEVAHIVTEAAFGYGAIFVKIENDLSDFVKIENDLSEQYKKLSDPQWNEE